jgi:transposase
MSRKKRYIRLSDNEIALLEYHEKFGKSASFRKRCRAILYSHRGFDISSLSHLFEATPRVIGTWFTRWETGQIEGLKTVVGQGRPRIVKLDDAPVLKIITDKIESKPSQLGTILAELEVESTLKMSRRTLRRLLKKTIIGTNA